MIGFIIAIIAGYCTPMIEASAARPVADAIGKWVKIEENEMRLLGFMLAMVLAGVLGALFESGNTFWLILGGTLGYFGTRIVAAGKAATTKTPEE